PYSYCKNNPVSMVDPSGWMYMYRASVFDGGPGLHPSIRCIVTMITSPSGAPIYLSMNWIGYFESLSIFADNLNPQGQIPMGSLVTRKTYEPCDASGYDRYGMDVIHFAENSAQKWQLADQSGTFPAILGDLVGADHLPGRSGCRNISGWSLAGTGP
ncbi:MAG: hypothetical protein QMD88_03120, partial [Coprothermobacterota bacterium]|nr:hypothetical protein [Coprothermobacterota bacterium]